MLLLVAVIIMPTVEEIGFRLSLKFKPIYLAMSLGVFLYYILTKAVYHTSNTMVDESFTIRFGTSIGLIILLYPIFNIKSIKQYLSKVWDDHFRTIYYLSCLAFARVHIFNYELSWINLLFLPVITLPQLLTGIISGYTRVAFGFRYPLVFHMATNLLAVGASLLPFAD